MNEQFPANPEVAAIELQNRVLDQIRFEAVKTGGPTEEMIDRHFAAYNFSNSFLKKELLAAYRQIQHKGETVPEYPSESFIKGSAADKRENAYARKLIAADSIAKSLREQHVNEISKQKAAHSLEIEKQDFQTLNEELQQKREQEIKKTYMGISPTYRSEFRTQAAEALKDSRESLRSQNGVLERDTEKIKDWQSGMFDSNNDEHAEDIKRAEIKLNTAGSEFDMYSGIEEPTAEDWKKYSQEESDAWGQKINEVITTFKRDSKQ